MLKLVFYRIIGLIGMFLVMSLVAYLAIRLIPGDPITVILGDRSAGKEVIERLKHLYGLDLPIWKHYLQYIYGVLHGNLGLSYFEVGKPVSEIVSDAFRVTLQLTLMAFPVALITGTTLGLAAAYHKDTWVDATVSAFMVLATSVPHMAIGSFLMIIFGLKLQILPVAGWGTPSEMVLPTFMVVLWPSASLAKLCRACLIEELGKDYIITARAKGLSEPQVFLKHAFVNTLVPISTSMGLVLGHLLEGSFITEILFNIPGLGRVAINAISQRDYPVVLATILLATLIYGSINLVVDLGYRFFDPRLNTGEK